MKVHRGVWHIYSVAYHLYLFGTFLTPAPACGPTFCLDLLAPDGSRRRIFNSQLLPAQPFQGLSTLWPALDLPSFFWPIWLLFKWPPIFPPCRHVSLLPCGSRARPSAPSVLITPGVAGTLLQSHTPWARVHPATCCISPLACDVTGRAGGTPEAMGPEVCGHCCSCHAPQPGDTCSRCGGGSQDYDRSAMTGLLSSLCLPCFQCTWK